MRTRATKPHFFSQLEWKDSNALLASLSHLEPWVHYIDVQGFCVADSAGLANYCSCVRPRGTVAWQGMHLWCRANLSTDCKLIEKAQAYIGSNTCTAGMMANGLEGFCFFFFAAIPKEKSKREQPTQDLLTVQI